MLSERGVLLAETHGAVMLSCRTLACSAKVHCRTLQIAEPEALKLENDYLAEPGMWDPFGFAQWRLTTYTKKSHQKHYRCNECSV